MGRQNRYNRNNKMSMKKEKVIMVTSSVLVLAALTMTGIYARGNSQKDKNDGYIIDFGTLENEASDEGEELMEQTPFATSEVPNNQVAETPFVQEEFVEVPQDDLDYSPIEEVGSGLVEIPGLTDENVDDSVVLEKETETLMEEAENSVKEEVFVPDVKMGDYLLWPVTGSVLIPFSMDQTVFFSTLEQYKYSPALVIAAEEGTEISAVAGGYVTDVFYDEEIGNAVSVDIGNGYEVTYGQLKDVSVKEGELLKRGDDIGVVAAPTKYYSVEGANAYFALTHDGESMDPLGALE